MAAKKEGRAYGRLTRHERNQVERMLDRGKSCREIAGELGRSPSTLKREVDRHRFVTAPRAPTALTPRRRTRRTSPSSMRR